MLAEKVMAHAGWFLVGVDGPHRAHRHRRPAPHFLHRCASAEQLIGALRDDKPTDSVDIQTRRSVATEDSARDRRAHLAQLARSTVASG